MSQTPNRNPKFKPAGKKRQLTRVEQIRLLNDWLRMHGSGGRIVMTAGISALSDEQRATVIAAIRQFDAFDEGNDPYGEHDCAMVPVTIEGLSEVMFKIDYYDLDLQHHSPDPADPDVTRRVMTVMLADEY